MSEPRGTILILNEPVTNLNNRDLEIKRYRYDGLWHICDLITQENAWVRDAMCAYTISKAFESRLSHDNREFKESGSFLYVLDDLSSNKTEVFKFAVKAMERVHTIANKPPKHKVSLSLYKSYIHRQSCISLGSLLLPLMSDPILARKVCATKEIWARLVASGALDMTLYNKMRCRNRNASALLTAVQEACVDTPIDNSQFINNTITSCLNLIFQSKMGFSLLAIVLQDICRGTDCTPIRLIDVVKLRGDFDSVKFFAGEWLTEIDVVLPDGTGCGLKLVLSVWEKRFRNAMMMLLRYNVYAPLLSFLPADMDGVCSTLPYQFNECLFDLKNYVDEIELICECSELDEVKQSLNSGTFQLTIINDHENPLNSGKRIRDDDTEDKEMENEDVTFNLE